MVGKPLTPAPRVFVAEQHLDPQILHACRVGFMPEKIIPEKFDVKTLVYEQIQIMPG